MDEPTSMNFQAYLEDTYRIIKEEPLVLILGGFTAQVLTALSLGIMAGPLMGGYYLLIIRYLRDHKKPSFNDIFSGLQEFGRLFPFFLVLLLILAGAMLLILPGLLLATWWLYVLPLMVDKNMDFREAMRISRNRVNESGFLMHFVFLLLITVIPMMLLNFLSAVLPFLFILKILLPPFQAGCLAGLYLDQFGGPVASGASTETGQEPAAKSDNGGTASGTATAPVPRTENEEAGYEPAADETAAGNEAGTQPPSDPNKPE